MATRACMILNSRKKGNTITLKISFMGICLIGYLANVIDYIGIKK